jgi:hypothetical protein
LTDYMVPQDELDMEEDDDDFESMLDNPATAVEGARVNSNLYDAYHTPTWTSHDTAPSRRPTHPAYSTTIVDSPETNVEPISSPPSPQRTGPWSVPPVAQYGGSTLHRQLSIRRPIRSRTVDFNDFTTRRRSTIRQAAESGGIRPGSEDGVDTYLPGTMRRRSRSPFDEATATPRDAITARRFFPFSRQRRRETSAPSWWTDGSEEILTDGPSSVLPPQPSASGSWFSLPTPTSSSSSQSNDAETSDERAQAPPPTPRLRRGGVRAPESMLSRHASPSIEVGDAYAIRMPPSPRSPLRFDDGHEELIADRLTQPESQNESSAGT